MEKIRCKLSNFELPKIFWAEAIVTSYFLINHPLSTVIEKKTPEDVWSEKPSCYIGLKIFGILRMLMLVWIMKSWTLCLENVSFLGINQG